MNSPYPILREAKVISVDDPESLGRIQLRVYPELSEHPEDDLPWCFPFSAGIDGKDFAQPEKDQLLTCVVWNRFWSEITFLPFIISKPKEHLFDKWMDSQRPALDDLSDDPEEKDLRVQQLSDDFSIFHDIKNSAHGILHPSGSYAMIDKDGNFFVKGVKELTVHDGDGNYTSKVDFTSGNVTLETKGKISNTIDKDVEEEIGGKWSVTVKGNASIESNGAIDIKASSSCKVEASSEVTVKAAQCVIDAPILNFKGSKSQGSVPPSGSGVFCAIPACVCSGAPHLG